MKILALTDIHAAYDNVERILAAERGCHAIILGGDLTTHGTAEEAAEALKRFSSMGIPLYTVAGNMDPRSLRILCISKGFWVMADSERAVRKI